jgi:hypothetical protein
VIAKVREILVPLVVVVGEGFSVLAAEVVGVQELLVVVVVAAVAVTVAGLVAV